MAPWQRLGFLLEFIFEKKETANALFDTLSPRILYHYPMDPGKEKKGFSSANRWKIIENRRIEGDL